MNKASNVVRRLLIAFVLQTMVMGASMAQSTDSTSHAIDTNPLNPDRVLDDIVPQPGAVFPVGVSQSWFDWKDDVYDKIGLKFGFSYQVLAQSATETLPASTYDTARGRLVGISWPKWSLLNKGEENEGTFVFSMFERGESGTIRYLRTLVW